MDYLDYLDLSYSIRDIIVGTGFLLGIGVGIYLIVRKRNLMGIFTILGFGLFCLEPIADFIIFRVLFQMEFEEIIYDYLSMAYYGFSAICFFLGSLALIIALVSVTRSRQPASEAPPQVSPGSTDRTDPL